MISIIVRNRNESEFIGFALQSILDNALNQAEVIIVDNNSDDDSLETVNLFKDRLDIKVIKIDDYTPGKSINLGVQNSTYPTILVLSAHVQIQHIDIEKINLQLKTYVAVMGKQIPIFKGKKITPRYIWSHFVQDEVENMYSEIEGRPFLHNALCAYRKDFLLEYPFDEKHPGKEDRYWAISMIDKGFKYLYSPELYGFHFYTTHGATWKGIG